MYTYLFHLFHYMPFYQLERLVKYFSGGVFESEVK